MFTDISIIIPTLNRDDMLGQTLTSIASVVPRGASVEIIVVDNGSVDSTSAVCRQVSAQFPKHRWCYLYDQTPGQLTGRHLGARVAQGQILAFLDDDVVLSHSWLESLYDAFASPKVLLASGPILPNYDVKPPSWIAGFWIAFEEGIRVLGELSLIDLGPVKKEVDPVYIGGANFAIRRTVFEVSGGFHPDCMPPSLQRYQGDGEYGLALKIKQQGIKALYHPGLAVEHLIPTSRLTPRSFELKGFYRGVCDSYTNIRRLGGLPPRTKSWKDRLRSIKWAVQRESLLRNPTVANVKFLTRRASKAGYWFHENEVRRDPKLLEWVLRPDYFEYHLPDGWQKYAT